MYKSFVLLLFILGLLFITSSVSYTVGKNENPSKDNIIYRYIPRTLNEEQKEPAPVSDIFAAMFTQPSTWIGGMNDTDTRKNEVINQYFVSQV
jgi:hypothetical protein